MSTALPSPLRLALVITELEVGGAEQALVNLATGLTRERFSPVVYSLKPRPKNDLLVQRLEQAKIPVHFLDAGSRWQFFSAVWRLAQFFRQQQPQVVQSFLFHANVVATLAARRAKVPRMVTGIRVADPNVWRQRVERWLTPKVDRIVCVSQGVADFCQGKCRFPSEKLVVIPNGVDMSRFEHVLPAELTELGFLAGHPAILHVGRLDQQKGLDWLLAEVIPRVFRELPQYDLLLVGDGPQRETLEEQARKHVLPNRVHFLGWRSDVPEILSASDLLVLASRWEGMPNVVLEAMAAGKPVVATQAEGVVELLGEGATQQSCPAGDAVGFAERIIRLAQDRTLAAELGAQNQRRAAAEFSLEAMISRYEVLYESLIVG
ncbi:MAG: glycosyltransferase [Pirellulaceae bacterium]|nr:glycosyltransferase [Pirellulaceae bacterium]